jgi:hypothetical protein
MRLSRLLSTAFVVGVASGATILACGGGGGDNPKVDAKVYMDAPKVFMDAPAGSGTTGLGQACTPDGSNAQGQGTCPTGYTCLSLNGGSGPWCSKTCMTGSADTCAVGYTGTGKPACVYQIRFGSGSPPVDYCGIICAEVTPMTICGAATCNGTCPTPLMCNATLSTTGSNGSAVAVGSACN